MHASPASRRAACLAAALAVAGCGGGETSAPDAPDPEPLTKEEFLFEADRICHSIEAEIEAGADDYAGRDPKDADPEEVRRLVNRIVVPRLRSEVDTIALLDPPVGDEAEVERILAATDRGTAALEEDPLIVLDGLPPELREAERLARAYGSDECGLR